MSESTQHLVFAGLAVAAWLAWACFSETRHNHGFWVALLLPLAPVIVPLVWATYQLIRGASYLVFALRGRRDEHAEFMRRLKLRSGVFTLF
ncbi:MAG: hypothetical protein AB7Q81_10145 [Gammaproteobacteria bacterium]